MAKVSFTLPDKELVRLSKLGKSIDTITENVLAAGAEVVYKQVKYHLAWTIGNSTKYESRSTGELERALGISKARIDRKGNMNIKVGFSEPRSDGNLNAKIVHSIEYGKSGQPARPFLARAKRQAKKPCEAAMKAKFEEELKKL